MRCVVTGDGIAGVCCAEKLRRQPSESGVKGVAQDRKVQVLFGTKVTEASNISKKLFEPHAQQHHLELLAKSGQRVLTAVAGCSQCGADISDTENFGWCGLKQSFIASHS